MSNYNRPHDAVHVIRSGRGRRTPQKGTKNGTPSSAMRSRLKKIGLSRYFQGPAGVVFILPIEWALRCTVNKPNLGGYSHGRCPR